MGTVSLRDQLVEPRGGDSEHQSLLVLAERVQRHLDLDLARVDDRPVRIDPVDGPDLHALVIAQSAAGLDVRGGGRDCSRVLFGRLVVRLLRRDAAADDVIVACIVVAVATGDRRGIRRDL